MAQFSAVPINLATSIKNIALTGLQASVLQKTNMLISNQIIPAQHVFNLVDKKLVVAKDCVLVFVDQMPQANWGHPCLYQFHDPATGAMLSSEAALFPPNLSAGGDVTFEAFHRPVSVLPVLSKFRTLADKVTQRLVLPAASSAVSQRYAVLWTSQISNLRHVEDLEFFWRTLVNVYGFNANNIHVLCYNGTIGATDASTPVGNWAGNDTPYQMKVSYAATMANLQTVFKTLAGKLGPKDLLLIHTNNHGSPSGCCIDSTTVMTPSQFASQLKSLPVFRDLIVTMEQCYSGAFQTSTLDNSTAVNTVFASAVPADKESAGAAHFDPWALALVDALASGTPSGGTISNRPTGNLEGVISIKAACDWAKANDTSSMDAPQFGEKPAGCSSQINLAPAKLPAQTGDTNADGRAELIVTSPWGIGVLEQAGTSLSGLVCEPNGTRFGQWLLNTADNAVGPFGDFNGDGKAEMLIYSPWGIGVLQQAGASFNALMMAPNGTQLGGWLLDTTQNWFGPAAIPSLQLLWKC